jgi:hypothetical protein
VGQGSRPVNLRMGTQIEYDEEFTRDWDWYAVDLEGKLGHFATAGFRPLPIGLKNDLEGTERCIQYFFEEAAVRCDFVVRAGLEDDAGGFKSLAQRDWYLKSFGEMGSKGLFSFDTELAPSPRKYYLVTIPKRPFFIDQLPPDVREIVARIRAPLLFEEKIYIDEVETMTW